MYIFNIESKIFNYNALRENVHREHFQNQNNYFN